jgi:hypothetical protein
MRTLDLADELLRTPSRKRSQLGQRVEKYTVATGVAAMPSHKTAINRRKNLCIGT